MEVLVKSKFITVTKPTSNTIGLSTGLILLKVTMKCACCQRDIPSFEIISDRLDEWKERASKEKNFQPLCKPCAKAHQNWHPKEKELNNK